MLYYRQWLRQALSGRRVLFFHQMQKAINNNWHRQVFPAGQGQKQKGAEHTPYWRMPRAAKGGSIETMSVFWGTRATENPGLRLLFHSPA